jgi:hypothetical protein
MEEPKEKMKRQISFGSLLKEMNIDAENKTSEELEDIVMKKLEEGEINVSRKNVEETWDNKCTLDTFNDWINVSAHKIACLDLIIQKYRWRLQNYILLGLILSTASGTISVTQFGSYDPKINFVLNLVFTIMSFAVAVLTGAVKTFKIQENLEEYISLKQNWISFSARISSEIYLPKRLRTDAEFLIKDSKTKFLDLLKIDVPVPKNMLVLAAKNVDKGDSLDSQYYEYLENKHKLERELQGGCMPCLSFMYDCCRCFYSYQTQQKIFENKELAKKIKFSKIDNAKKYKQKAYQYTLSSIMLNGVKTEVNSVCKENQNTIECQTEMSGDYYNFYPSTPNTSSKKTKKSLLNYFFGSETNAPNPSDTEFWQQFQQLQDQIQSLQMQMQEQQRQISFSQPQNQIVSTVPEETSTSQGSFLSSLSDGNGINNEIEIIDNVINHNPSYDEDEYWQQRYC